MYIDILSYKKKSVLTYLEFIGGIHLL